MSLQDRANKILADVDALMRDFREGQKSNLDKLVRELERRGYEVDGKSEDEIAEILKRPPTKREQP